MIDVIGIDAPCMDFLVDMDQLPTRNCSQQFRQASWQGGGKAATALIALARLGVPCGIVANVGDDLYGDVIAWDFQRHGVDTAHLHRVAGRHTSLSLIIAERETQGRSILWQGHGAPLVTGADLDAAYLAQAKYLHVLGVEGVCAEAMAIVRAAGGQIVIDADRYQPSVMGALDRIDVFIGSEFFFDKIAEGRDVETCCRDIQAQGPHTVIFTFGERGCQGVGPDSVFFTEPAHIVPVVDTTGAGDVFHGAYIYGLLQGWTAPACARWASAVSAIKVTRLGGRAGIPDVAMTRAFLETGAIDGAALDERCQWYANTLENTLRETGRVRRD